MEKIYRVTQLVMVQDMKIFDWHLDAVKSLGGERNKHQCHPVMITNPKNIDLKDAFKSTKLDNWLFFF